MKVVAVWYNKDKTIGVRLWEDGSLTYADRENSGCVWSPPTFLQPYAFEVNEGDRCNLVGVTWHR
jgi:hypothetical protein